LTTSNKYNYLDNFDLPRTISKGLKLKIFFGNPFAAIGIAFFLFGSIFPTVFGSMVDFKSAFNFKDSDPSINGIVISKEETGNKENKRKIYDYGYEYRLNGKTYTGHSFAKDEDIESGDSVIVQYVANEADLSRIQNMRAAPFNFWVLPLTCIFPLIGFIFLLVSINKARKNIYLVQNGILTKGKVVRKEPTNTKINKQTVYKVFFEFKTRDGNIQEAYVRSHIVHNLGDEAEEPLVYDANEPSQAVLLDSLPKKIKPLIIGQ
jgi:hypothetical protein